MPRKIMLALVPAGGGHAAVARAVSEALSALDPTVEISVVNVSGSGYRLSPVNAIPSLYAAMTIKAPPVWRAVFHATNGRRRYAAADAVMQLMVRPRLKALLKADPPDVAVSLNPALGPIMRDALADLGLRTPLGIVVSDLFTLHQAWFCPGASWHAVPTEAAREACVAAGIEPATVHVTGQPVARSFEVNGAARADLRRALGLPEDEPVVLVAGGGEGVGRVEETVRALLAASLPCRLVVITGRNEGLRRRLLAHLNGDNCRVLGYVNNMADWMRAADILISKAGPNTVMEAVHCNLPMILTGAVPGQEEANLTFVAANGLGVVATRPADAVEAASQLLADGARVEDMRRATARFRRPGAAQRIARLILASV